MIAVARRAAHEILLAVDAGRADLATALADGRDRLSDPRDRALATEIATGVLRWRNALDFQIAAMTWREPAALDVEVLAVLRAGLYQLQHATRIPASAVVNDAVEIIKRGRTRSASGLVNAILRRAGREGAPPLPPRPDTMNGVDMREQMLTYLSVTHSHPRWLVDRWLDAHGAEAVEAWVRFNNVPASVTIWPAPVSGQAGVDVVSTSKGDSTRRVPGGKVLTSGKDAMAPLREGLVYAQDEASAAVGRVAAAVAHGVVLDACASPGGKSLVMLSHAPLAARLLAADMRARRVALLAATLRRLAGRPVPVIRLDAAALPFAASVDTLLIDAPCSGLGTLRREPDLRWRRTADDLPGFVALQRRMLEAGLEAVAAGGRVVYATCSSEPEENEHLVEDVLARRREWRRLNLETAGLPDAMRPMLQPDGTLRSWPHVHGLDAFFAAALVRSAGG